LSDKNHSNHIGKLGISFLIGGFAPPFIRSPQTALLHMLYQYSIYILNIHSCPNQDTIDVEFTQSFWNYVGAIQLSYRIVNVLENGKTIPTILEVGIIHFPLCIMNNHLKYSTSCPIRILLNGSIGEQR
jgi:hypothetical protein